MKAEISIDGERWRIQITPETTAEDEFFEFGPDRYEVSRLGAEEAPTGAIYMLTPIWDKEPTCKSG